MLDIKYALKQYKKFEKSFWKGKEKKGEEQSGQEQEELTQPVLEEEESLLEDNTDSVETFGEVALVEGQWVSDGHRDIIDQAEKGAGNPQMAVGFNQDELGLIKAACVAVDNEGEGVNPNNEEHFRINTLNVFHGRYNYIGTMDYLYKVARDVCSTGDNVTVNASCKKFVYNPECKKSTENQYVASAVVKAVQHMASAGGPMNGISAGKSVPWKRRRALAILGMVLHTVGDTYAHKTKVPTTVRCSDQSTATSIASAGLQSWASFQDEVYRGMEFKRIKQYVSGSYEDNATFFPERYATAQRVSNMVLRHFTVGSPEMYFDKEINAQTKRDSFGVVQENRLAYYIRHVAATYGIARSQEVCALNFYPHKSEYGDYDYSGSSK